MLANLANIEGRVKRARLEGPGWSLKPRGTTTVLGGRDAAVTPMEFKAVRATQRFGVMRVPSERTATALD
jgi:hypothetical protein